MHHNDPNRTGGFISKAITLENGLRIFVHFNTITNKLSAEIVPTIQEMALHAEQRLCQNKAQDLRVH